MIVILIYSVFIILITLELVRIYNSDSLIDEIEKWKKEVVEPVNAWRDRNELLNRIMDRLEEPEEAE